MADAKKCDRCGKFYIMETHDLNRESSLAYIAAHKANDYAAFEYDLCDTCFNEFFNWLEEKENAEN